MHRRPLAPACLLAVGALLLSIAPVLPTASLAAQGSSDEMERPLVRKVHLRGVKSVDSDELRQSIATRASGCRSLIVSFLCAINDWDAVYDHQYLDRQEFRKDVLRIKVFYWKRGFREADVDTAVVPRDGEKVRVSFKVTEGPPTLVERVEVMRPTALLPDRALRRLVQVKAGQPFDTYKLDSTLMRLRQAMWQRGFADAEVEQRTAVDTGSRRAVVAIGVASGPQSIVGSIHVRGAEKVSEEAIRNSLLFKQGEVFRLDDLLRSQRALYESGLFRRAALFVAPTGGRPVCEVFASGMLGDLGEGTDSTSLPDSVKRIEVCVEEAPLREARASAGFNTVEFIQVEGRFSHLNFLGGARRLDMQAAVGNLLSNQLNGRNIFQNVGKDFSARERSIYFAPTYQASISLSQRWFYDPRNTLSAGLFANRRSAPGIFVDEGYGATSTLTRLLAERVNLSANYRYEITTVDAGDVYFCVNYGVCDDGTIDALRGNQRMSPVTLTGTIDRSSDPFEPVTGYRLRAEAEHASQFTMSDYRYNRGSADYSVYRRLGRTGTLASRVRGGWVRALASTADATGASGARDTDILHPRRRFYAGGSQSVRGFGENQLGPRVVTISAATLRGTDNSRCAAADIRDCNPNGTQLTRGSTASVSRTALYSNNDFIPRPLGGNLLAEGSVELRMPIFKTFAKGNLLGAVFVDAGWLRGRTLGGDIRADGAITPGLGIRYRSPVGPIRVDVGLNPSKTDSLPVITEEIGTDGVRRLVELHTERAYNPVTGASPFTRFFQRLTLHLSIGEAF
jgi:outer membrane protein insertion porin family/translocation and assembly module TamA